MKWFHVFSVMILAAACSTGGNEHPEGFTHGDSLNTRNATEADINGVGNYSGFTVADTIDQAMAVRGEQLYTAKCASCHKLNTETLVGPGWKGTTQLYTSAWLMNFMTNTDEMLNTNPQAKELLDIYLVRMPATQFSEQEARDVLEFMRKNDAESH